METFYALLSIIIGPYFSYRTFRDYLYLPFSEKADSIKATLHKLKVIPLFASLFLLASYIWPLSVICIFSLNKSSSSLYI